MTPAYQQLFQEMRRRLSGCDRGRTDRLWTLLQQTAIAKSYRNRLPLAGVPLTRPEYFKDHLPRFEAEVQYYELRYEAERCRPEQKDPSWAGFWTHELSRLTELSRDHPRLYTYFLARRTDRDNEYFGGDPSVAEKNATLWASFRALTRYETELEKRFAQLLTT